MNIKNDLEIRLSEIVSNLLNEDVKAQIEIPKELEKGDFTSNISLKLKGKLGSPMEAGEKIVEKLREDDKLYSKFSKIELLNPGFINFYLSKELIISEMDNLLKPHEIKFTDEDLILEFGDLNPFKEPHIGHLRNLNLGEALARIHEYLGIKVIRANYEGDVGLHVAKCIWGIQNSDTRFQDMEGKPLEEIGKYLGSCYASGAKAYDSEDLKAKEEIIKINNKIYMALKDHKTDLLLYGLWQSGRKWSLEYFEELYKMLGVKYEKYYFESETADHGKELVLTNPQVFIKDDNAFIFKGEDYGLHNRVFINSEGNPTYEAKELGLAFLKNNDFPEIKKSIIMTANEQSDYFKVLIKALSEINKNLSEKTTHLSYGFIDLKEGKMSSRSGNIVSAFWLLSETKKRLKEGFKEVNDSVAQDLAVGAVKWSMLKFSRESNISFSIEESIDLAGNSGPYMQYTYARISSILEKAGKEDIEANSVKILEGDLLALSRLICQFENVIKQSVEHFSPNFLTEYLFLVAQKYNAFYEKERIIGEEDEMEKLVVSKAVKNVIGQGLNLLGINTPEKI